MLIAGLPDDNAIARAVRPEKHLDLTERLLWEILGQSYHMVSFWRAYLSIKPEKDRFAWPATPWEKSTGAGTRVGKVAPGDQEAAMEFLMGLNKKS